MSAKHILVGIAMALFAVACGSVSPEPAADADLMLLSTAGIGDMPFGADFDDALEYVNERLGPADYVQRQDGGGCDAFGGCQLQAGWDAGFMIAGPFDANTLEFWAVIPDAQLDDVFALPVAISMGEARDPASWPVEVDAVVSQLDDSWLLSFGDLGFWGRSFHEVPPGNWITESPDFPDEAEVDWIYHVGTW